MDLIKTYPASTHGDVFIARDQSGRDVLVRDGKPHALDHEAACWLRERFPFTAPSPVLGRDCTFGVGDRLGIAAPGHIRVFNAYDAVPVLVQQSVRELTLTGRSWEDILDCVTFMAFREGYTGGFGADGDHLKQKKDIADLLALGFTMVTLDCSDHIRKDDGEDRLPDELANLYLGKAIDLDGGQSIALSRAELAAAYNIYGEAVEFAASVWDEFFADGCARADFEMSIDETELPTTPAQHFFVAAELQRRGVRLATMAPRFCGEFQKGIDYIGDKAQFEREIITHAAIARHFGYKLSIHSGSDKFSVFPLIGKHTQGRFHVKTAGTNWLEAMRIVAEHDPALYRRAHAFAAQHVEEARKYYHVKLDMAQVPDPAGLKDHELPALFDMEDPRQLIHITYGLILSDPGLHGALYSFWDTHADAYAAALEQHIGKHLSMLGVTKIQGGELK